MKGGRGYWKKLYYSIRLNHRIYVPVIACALTVSPLFMRAQEIQGTVYDITQKIPLPGVSVLTASGSGTQTDSMGFYRIRVTSADSVWFSYLGKATPQYPVKTIQNPAAFDISIQISAIELPGVTVRKPNYRFDSLQNRREYERVFNYRRPGLRVSTLSPGSVGAGAGVDINELINVFRFRRNRNMKFLHRWLIKEEQEKYIDYRYSKLFVRKLTGLESPELDGFMRYYRPQYEYVVMLNDAELGLYILECFKEYNSPKRRSNN
ncbi:carboxypeptidase-like regulatory domain-containing protein [Agriterribacter sp.]|uniref:carboxypeptidase-like regulatory domain-containing protein n=1 Tax=Agriterribacter sp. TaxID=2821509 RepID=UPI002C48FF7E|nr:carboxypeptidase-like regulatory domain-containing protein [Agriterribacter sp.]HRP54696.1 carboxypeptidase-like regulatory domain-containing protein [Agriterribacter sp.]